MNNLRVEKIHFPYENSKQFHFSLRETKTLSITLQLVYVCKIKDLYGKNIDEH